MSAQLNQEVKLKRNSTSVKSEHFHFSVHTTDRNLNEKLSYHQVELWRMQNNSKCKITNTHKIELYCEWTQIAN